MTNMGNTSFLQKTKALALAFSFGLIAWTPMPVLAQAAIPSALTNVVNQMVESHDGKTMCSVGTPEQMGLRVLDHLRATGKLGNGVTAGTVWTTLWELFPCPFSPYRPELRLATAKDIEGVWVFPETSQKLRFGPTSPQKSPTGTVPLRCDVVAYYPDGEARHAIIGGENKCPFSRASDMDPARKNPRVVDWKMLRDGRVSITRTDVPNHIEEWDIYAVVAPFTHREVSFSAGELVAYARRDRGNDGGASTSFRHLQKLP